MKLGTQDSESESDVLKKPDCGRCAELRDVLESYAGDVDVHKEHACLDCTERRAQRRQAPAPHRTHPAGAHPPTMQIFAKTLIGKTITIDVEDFDNSTIIKSKIEYKTKVPIDQFHLLLHGKPWGDDNSTISDHYIQKDDTVRMVAGLIAGMKIVNPFRRGPKPKRIANEDYLIYRMGIIDIRCELGDSSSKQSPHQKVVIWMTFALKSFIQLLIDFCVLSLDSHEIWNLQDDQDDDEPTTKRLCIADEASLIYGAQGIG